MNRVEAIKNYKEKCDEEKMNKEIERQNKIESYKKQILELKPRIDGLLEVGNACKENGIKLVGQAWGGHEGYDTCQFISNSWSHLVGFISEGNNKPFTKVGKIGGGACNYNLKTDGVNIEVSGDVEYVLKNFVDKFNTFETEFYNYVDKIVGK